MSCLNWNYCGLRNPQTEDELVALVYNKDPMLVFLMETKVEKYVLERIGREIQYSNLFVVPRHNIGGGLALFGKLTLMWMCNLILIVILMLLLTMELMTPSDSWVSMVTLILLTGKTPGPCLELFIIG